MDQFKFTRAATIPQAVQSAAVSSTAQQGADVRFVAGGTTLIDLMKLRVEQPKLVVDINGLPLDQIETLPDGGLRIGALVRNSDLAHHPAVQKNYAALSQALLSGASPQLRNMATTSGNLLQRTRCVYFRDTAHACNKREPGSGCSAIGGHNRMLAILGTSKDCIATNPSDMNVALAAHEATIQVRGVQGPGVQGRGVQTGTARSPGPEAQAAPQDRSIPIQDFHLLPGSTPHRETVLQPGDLITSITLPAPALASRSVYVKLRDRAAYEFALASAAVVLQLDGKTIQTARIALGGVGTKPWRSFEAEKVLHGRPIDAALFRRAAEAALKDAHPQSENEFKVELSKRCLVRALTLAAAASPTQATA